MVSFFYMGDQINGVQIRYYISSKASKQPVISSMRKNLSAFETLFLHKVLGAGSAEPVYFILEKLSSSRNFNTNQQKLRENLTALYFSI